MADNTEMCTHPEPLPADTGLLPDPGLPLDLELPLEHNLPLEVELPLEPQAIPLVFNDLIDTTNMANVLLIDSTLADKQIFYESANANTFPIIYDSTSKTDDLLALLRQKFPASSIKRISIAFHGRGGDYMAPFMNNKLLFQESDLAEGQTSFSENLSHMITCMNEFRVEYIDFLACNTLQYSNWKSYYALLAAQTSVVVGASNDATGNIKYGGDWVMESTGQDIKQIYFTDSIEYYKYLLATYTLDNIVYTYTAGAGNPASVTGFVTGITTANIPSTITPDGNTYNVTSIGDYAFNGCTTLASITMPSSLTTIGGNAFQFTSALTSITIPNSVTTIGSFAFQSCPILASITLPTNVSFTILQSGLFQVCTSLASITIPNSVTSIGSTAFSNCRALTSITIPNSVATIGNDAFYGCTSLAAITIPNSVTSIGSTAFQSCTALTSITIPSSVTTIGPQAFYNCTALTSITIPSSVTSIETSAFYNCTALTAFSVNASNPNFSSDAFGVLFNKLQTTLNYYPIGNTQTSYTIPSSVTSITSYAFYNGIYLTSVTIPNSVTSIGTSAFQSCASLASITIPNSVTTFGTYVFQSCTSLTSVTLPTNALFTTIQTSTFNSCTALTSVTIPNSVTSIAGSSFYNCTALASVTLPTNVSFTSIAGSAFSGCITLASITIPNSVTTIGTNAFNGCTALTSVTLPTNALFTTIQTSTFTNCTALTSITIPNSVTSIGTQAFNNCTALTSVTIPSSVTTFGTQAFYNCTALTSITIPSSVTTTIGTQAFYNCTALTAFSVNASNPSFSSDAFGVLFNKLQTTLSYYPIGNTRTSYTIPSSVTSITSNAFYKGIYLTSVTIPSSVTAINTNAFENCTALSSVTIPSSVITIGTQAFYNCTALTAFSVNASNPSFSSDASGVLFDKLQTTLNFYPIGNTRTSYTIPSSVGTITSYAFYNGIYLNSVTIPSSVASIGTQAFQSCTALTAFSVDVSNPSFSSDAFGVLFNKNKTTLNFYPIGNTRTSYTIPSSVGTITSYAFYNGIYLNSVTIPSSVGSIGTQAFYNCTALTAFSVDVSNPNFSSDASGVLFNKLQTTLNYYPIGNTRTSYTIPSSVGTITSYAFYKGIYLNSVTIPSSVGSIGTQAFQNCSNLNLVYFLRTPLLPTLGTTPFSVNPPTSVGKYYSTATNASTIAPFFTSLATITLPTLTSITPFTSASPSAVVVISYANLVANGNESVDTGLTYVFLVNSVSSGSLSIGATEGSATPWNASTNKTISSGTNAYWTPAGGSGLVNSFSVVIQDSLGAVSSPNVQVEVNLSADPPTPEHCFLEGTKILCFENNEEVYRPIESLRKGDLVKTIYNGYMPINMIGTSRIYNPGNDYRVANRLYKCSREKYPTLFEDLYITGCHSILVPQMTDDQWENTKAVNGDVFVTDNHFRLVACADEKAQPYDYEGFMNIYHIALEHHDALMNYGIYANGLLVESCSERNLRYLSNMRILGEADCAVSEGGDKVLFIIQKLVETY